MFDYEAAERTCSVERGKGVVAIQRPAIDRGVEEENLENLLEVETEMEDADLLMRCWIARIHLEMSRDVENGGKRAAREARK